MKNDTLLPHEDKVIALEKLSFNHVQKPSTNYVVSYNQDGTPLSRYGDAFWDRTPYGANARKFTLNFEFWKTGHKNHRRTFLQDEIRWFLFILIFIRQGPTLSNGTLAHYKNFLSNAAIHCEENNLTVQELFSNDTLFLRFMNEAPLKIKFGCGIISVLLSLDHEVIGFFPISISTLNRLNTTKNRIIENYNQHNPLPTRVYSYILNQLSKELEIYEKIIQPLLAILVESIEDPLYGKQKTNQFKYAKKLSLDHPSVKPNFTQVLIEHNLMDFWTERNLFYSLSTLKRVLNEAMLVAMSQIQAFTGMRRGEAEILPYDCLEIKQNHSTKNNSYFLHGFTTKRANGKKVPAKWVTCEVAARAVKLAQTISSALYQSKGFDPTKKSKQKFFYLFLSTSSQVENAPPGLNLCDYPHLRSRLQPSIMDSDIKELETIDPHRAWRSEPEFKIGIPWSFSSHQLRRSLALYAQRSGIVTLPSLKRQLQQITQQMASYYARGSHFAKSIIEIENHFVHEWLDAEPISQYFGYVLNVLENQENVFGPHQANLIQKYSNGEGVIVVDKEALRSSFNKGLSAYSETILGGCVKVGPCNKNPIDLLHIDCIKSRCKNLVVDKRKLENLIKAESNFVTTLSSTYPESSMYRHEMANLQILKEAYKANSK